MRLHWNFLAGLAQSVISAIVGLAVVPFYLHYLGVEAYGLIGFFMAMQGLFILLDMGLAPTMTREVARANSADTVLAVRDLLYTLAKIYWVIAIAICAFLFLLAPLVAKSWLQETNLDSGTVAESVALMGVVIACRFPVGLYLGVLVGGQRLVLSSGITIASTVISSIGAVLVLAFVSPTLQAFFLWQAGTALLYAVATWAFAWRSLPAASAARMDFKALKRVWRFSAGMAATALLGTVFIHSDKVVLSRMVSLEELGRYTIAGLLARTLYLFLTPTFNAVYPRLTSLYAAEKTDELTALYGYGTRLTMAVIFPMAAYVGIFSQDIILLWTGDAELAAASPSIVAFLLIGTAFNGAMHFPYALQLAAGRSRLPVTINSILIVGFIPLLILLTALYGVVGGAAAWAILNAAYLLLGTWLTHRVVLQGRGAAWLLGDVGLPFCAALLVVLGGLAVRGAGLPPLPSMIVGAALPALAFALVIATSPHLIGIARGLFGGLSRTLNSRA